MIVNIHPQIVINPVNKIIATYNIGIKEASLLISSACFIIILTGNSLKRGGEMLELEVIAILLNAIMILTNAIVIMTNAIMIVTNAIVIMTNAIAIMTNAIVIVTNAIVIVTNAIVIMTNAIVIMTNAIAIMTNAIAIVTNAIVICVDIMVILHINALETWISTNREKIKIGFRKYSAMSFRYKNQIMLNLNLINVKF